MSVAALCERRRSFFRVSRSAAPTDVHSVVFSVALKPNAAASCDSMLMDISSVGSPNYGKFLSFNRVGELFRNRAAEKAAKQWMRKHGIALHEMKMTPHGEFIRVTTTVAKLEKLLGATFSAYAAVEDSKVTCERCEGAQKEASHMCLCQRVVHRDLNYQLPNEVRPFIRFVSDTAILPVPPSMRRRAFRHAVLKTKSRDDGNVSPSLLNSQYGITSNNVASPASTLSLFESLGQDYSPSDLTQFQQQFNLPQTSVGQVVGNNDPTQCASNPNNCGEANLDVQYAFAVANNVNMTYWSVDGDGDIFVEWIEAVTASPNPPLVHSLSYGSLAPENPKFDVEQFNTAMCKLGLKGLTLVVATGDDGVANYVARQNSSACGFTPSFPATSPYCLAVGATMGPETGAVETACTSDQGGLITTGGGFSTYVNRPSWQNDIVNAYLAGGPSHPTSPPRSLFSSLGRAYPDVAMIGHK